MSADACTNEEWAAENGESIEWARAMWHCACSKCSTPRERVGA